jgi:hypothetical protein
MGDKPLKTSRIKKNRLEQRNRENKREKKNPKGPLDTTTTFQLEQARLHKALALVLEKDTAS